MSDPTDRCRNCDGTERQVQFPDLSHLKPEQAADMISGDLNPKLVCADCSHPWGEPPTRPKKTYTTKVKGNDGRIVDLGAGERVPTKDDWHPVNAWTEQVEDASDA